MDWNHYRFRVSLVSRKKNEKKALTRIVLFRILRYDKKGKNNELKKRVDR